MRNYLIVLCLLILPLRAIYGQDEYIGKLYKYQSFLLNPATAANNSSYISFFAFYQKQWIDTEKSPSTQILSAEVPLKNIGLGTYLFNDANGTYKHVGLHQSFSYQVKLYKSRRYISTLSFGIGVSVSQTSVDVGNLSETEILDPAISHSNLTGVSLDANTGVLWKLNDYYVGLSVLNLLPQNNHVYNHPDEPKKPFVINLMAGTSYKVVDKDIFFEPSFRFLKSTGVDNQIDFNLNNYWYTQGDFGFWFLYHYRHTLDKGTGKCLGMTITPGLIYKNISAGLEYQLGLTKAQLDYGSYYQLVVSYKIECDKKKGRIPCSIKRKDKRHKMYKYITY